MELSPSRCTLALALLPVVAAVARAQVTIADELFPGATDRRGSYVTRLVDDLSGAPIAGAEVFLVPESKTPIAGEFWFVASGVSDAEGFVRIPQAGPVRDWHLQVMKHPERGVAARSDYVEPVWRIGRTFDVPLEILGPDGQPAAGASVGFCAGCGHSPDIATATADANGFAVLRGVDPRQDIRDLYVQHPGLQIYYDSVEWRPGEPPMPVRCRVGPTQSGRVVDHEGQPVAGAFVQGGGFHRGPWARTAADGTFTILGASPGETPFRAVLASGREVWFDVRGANPYPITLRLADPTGQDPDEAAVETAANAPAQPPATRRVRLVVDGADGAAVDVAVHYVGRPADAAEAAGHVDVPRGAPFAVVLERPEARYGEERWLAFADGDLVDDPLVLPWQPDPRVRGRSVDPAGVPVAARVRWSDWSPSHDAEPWLDDDGEFDVSAAHRRGWNLLEVAPHDANVRRRLVWVLVPAAGGVVDLGGVVVGSAPQLTVVDERGVPLRDATVAFARPGWQEVGETWSWPLDENGEWTGPDLREGDAVVVHRDAALPFRTLLRGPGPWTIVPPDGAVALEVVDAAGDPLDSTVVVGDLYEESKDGRFALRGLPLGATRLHVGAQGHRSAFVDVTVTVDAATLRVELPRR